MLLYDTFFSVCIIILYVILYIDNNIYNIILQYNILYYNIIILYITYYIIIYYYIYYYKLSPVQARDIYALARISEEYLYVHQSTVNLQSN